MAAADDYKKKLRPTSEFPKRVEGRLARSTDGLTLNTEFGRWLVVVAEWRGFGEVRGWPVQPRNWHRLNLAHVTKRTEYRRFFDQPRIWYQVGVDENDLLITETTLFWLEPGIKGRKAQPHSYGGPPRFDRYNSVQHGDDHPG